MKFDISYESHVKLNFLRKLKKKKKKKCATILNGALMDTWSIWRCENIAHIEGWAQDCHNSNIFLKPLFRGNFDSFVNNANLGATAHTSKGT